MAAIDWEARVRDAFEAFNRGDFESVLSYASDDIELRRVEDSPDSRDIIRGREKVADFLRPDMFVDQSSELIELVQGDGAIMVKLRVRARGAGSGLPLELEAYIVWRIVDDLVTRIEFHNELDRARQAAGLDPSPEEGNG